ncbi:MAG TPA: UDP-N-acetylmuramate dehydrogenase [Thermodesulfovibrionia bacterium]|nr:UDP-N-acetylmuramate dehydrogenase [Thermodesulfovibrionia bacterium]
MKTKLQKLFNLSSDYRGVVRFNEPMAEHTSLGLGGAVDVYAVPEDLGSLRFILKVAYDNGMPIFPVGHGTNLLIKDGGIRGIVLSLKSFNRLEVLESHEQETVYLAVGAGVALGRLIQFTVQHGYAGLEGLAGIPGTVGGGVFMNAGSFGAEIGDCVVSVDVLEKDGFRRNLDAKDLNFSYRSSCIPEGAIVIEAVFRFKQDESSNVKGRVKECLERKKSTQPLGFSSAGCVFKNINGNAAGRLLDLAGCKGMKIGGAEISTVHANFIINHGDRAEDFLALMEKARERVKMLFDVELKPEIQIIGEDRMEVFD